MRLANWECRLNAAIADWSARPFRWGETDCCTFAAACAQAVTGDDYREKFAGNYTSALGAGRVLKRYGGVEGVVRRAGLEPCPPAYAQRGDIVAVMQGRDMALGVCVGGHVMMQGEDGLRRLPLGDAVRAWRVV